MIGTLPNRCRWGWGYCGLPVKELTALATKLLEVSDDLIPTALGLEPEAG